MFYVQESCVVTDRAKIIFGLKRTSPLPRVHAKLQCPGIKHLKDNKTGRKSYRDANANGSLIVMLMSMIFVKTVWLVVGRLDVGSNLRPHLEVPAIKIEPEEQK